MKYLWAFLAVIGEVFAYMLLCGAMGWRAGGGAIVMIGFIALAVGTWRGITKKEKPLDKHGQGMV